MTFCLKNNNSNYLSFFYFFFVITTCNLTRSPGGEFLSAVVFGRRGIFVGEGFWLEVFFFAGGGFDQRGVFAKGKF